MVKLFSQTHTFHHPFANVTSAFWRKYPNELAPHVKAIDCYDRTIDPKTGNLIVHRILSCETAIPSWMSSLGVSNTGYVAETTVVNSEKQKMVVRSRNITGSSIMAVEETCTYTVDRHNPAWTHYRQQAKIMAFMPMLKSKFENYSFNSMAGKSQHGLIAIESLCQRIGRDGLWSLVDEFVPESAKQAIADVQQAVTSAATTSTITSTATSS